MSLSHDEECYGLIHGDINIGNFCFEKDKITLLDFDEWCKVI
jgi:Ser/Thr protein kinase RdoA (MazF antagonist)